MTTADAYKRVTFHGHTFNKRTAAALMEMERRLGYELTVIQGSYNHGVGASAGTHDGGGAVDLAPWDFDNKVRAGRRVGFAMWHRQAIPGTWVEHIHGGLIGDKEAAPALAAQFSDYASGLDGLADNAHDSTPRPSSRFHYWLWRKFHPGMAKTLDALPSA